MKVKSHIRRRRPLNSFALSRHGAQEVAVTTLAPTVGHLVRINPLTVEPSKTDKLLQVSLSRDGECHAPVAGVQSANLHVTRDGRHVANCATRRALAELWLRDAEAEYASVPAFGQVAWQLAALGSPASLLARANRGALDEIDHAERCYALASAYAGRALGPAPMRRLSRGMGKLPRSRAKALSVVAGEALVGGAFLESYNAALAHAWLEDATEAASREALTRMAVDEASHAELAWDIIAFCIDSGGEPVVRRLRGVARLVAVLPTPAAYRHEHLALVALADPHALRAHGRGRPEAWALTYASCRNETLTRLERLLAGAPRKPISSIEVTPS